MQTVYVDSVFCFNAVADYLMLRLTAAFAGLPTERKRNIAAAIFGGGYALAAAIEQDILLSAPVKTAVSLLLVWLAFGKAPLFLRRWLFFLTVSAAFSGFTVMLSAVGGVAGGVPFDFIVFIGATGLSYLLLSVFFKGSGEAALLRELTDAKIRIGEGERKCRTLLDSGCSLKDPRTGVPVLIVERSALAGLPVVPTGELSFESLGGGGTMETFYADALTVGGKTYAPALLALAPERVRFGDGYRAIFGKGE